MSDRPTIRASLICPMCRKEKSAGTLLCPACEQEHKLKEGNPEVEAALDAVEGRDALHGGTAHIAFGVGDGLGLRDFRTFAAQCPTPHNCCVRFAAAVADAPRNTRYRAVASLTRTGLSPAGPDQLVLTHPQVLDRLSGWCGQRWVQVLPIGRGDAGRIELMHMIRKGQSWTTGEMCSARQFYSLAG